jgi:signal transduction histidine kinase
VKFEAEEGQVLVIIRDDGHGFSPKNLETVSGRHFGLQFMQERAGQLGGNLQIQSTPGKGTEVVLEVPKQGIETVLAGLEKEAEYACSTSG